MMRKILLLLGVVLAGSIPVAQAQLMKVPDYAATLALIKAQPLVVLLHKEEPKELRKLAGKPKELAQYRADVALCNKQLQEYAPKLWHYSPAVVFKPQAEHEALRKTKGTITPVLYYVQRKASQTMAGPMGNRLEEVSFGSEMVANLRFDMVGDDKDNSFWHGPAPLGGALSLSDIISSFRALQSVIDIRAATADKKEDYRKVTAAEMLRGINGRALLRTKILLINRADLDEGLTEADVKKLYPFPCQLVPMQAIETAVVAGDTRYTYARWLTLAAGEVGPAVIDAATGKVITQSASKEGIGKANLKSFAQTAASAERDARLTEKLEKIMRESD